MDAHAVSVVQGATTTRVDVPMRVFFDVYYPLLARLYAHLGIETEEVNYSASFSSLAGELFFQYDNYRFERYRIPFLTWSGLTHPVAWRIGADAIRFFGRLSRDLAAEELRHLTLEQYLRTRGLSTAFWEQFLLPAYAGICTCSYESLRRYPARTILGYLGSGLLTAGVRRVRDGAQRIVERLAANAEDVRCGTAVAEIRRNDTGVELTDARGEARTFDHVVLATQANHSLRILADASSNEREMLSAFRYESSTVLLHTDPRLAPRQRAWWAPVNFLLRDGSRAPMATILLNPVHRSLAREPTLFQTWNPLIEPDASQVLSESTFERPVVDGASLDALERLTTLHDETERRVWFCGAYAAPGIPLLESAALSGARVAEKLACGLPWAGTKPARDRRHGGVR